MCLEPVASRETVVNERQQQRVAQRCERVAQREARADERTWRCAFDRQANAFPRSEIDHIGALNEEAIGEHSHAKRGGRVQDDRRVEVAEIRPKLASRTAGGRRIFVYDLRRMLRFLTAGESHGRALVAILEGLPAGLPIDVDAIARELRRRQGGYGRGRRMAIESDRADILSGVREGETLGGPVALLIENRDWVNWQHTMRLTPDAPADAGGAHRAPVTRPRPGHADLAGGAKYERADLRDVLERASARETAARVAIGAVARQFLARLGIRISSHVFNIGGISAPEPLEVTFAQADALEDEAPIRCVDKTLERRIIAEIDRAREAGDTLGGAFEVIATGIPVGLGSYVQWDRKLDGRLAQAMMSIPAIKAVGIGIGPDAANRPGSRVHDEIVPASSGARATGLARPTNNAGGLEGGVTNGEDLRVSAYMKPISTLMKPLRSVDLETMQEAPAAIERSDVCAVPAAAVVGEAMVAFVLADAVLERFGGDSLAAVDRAMKAADARIRDRFSPRPAGAGPPASDAGRRGPVSDAR
jgi:chorismate synthase